MTAAALTLSTQVPVNALAGINQSHCIKVLLWAMSIKVYVYCEHQKLFDENMNVDKSFVFHE